MTLYNTLKCGMLLHWEVSVPRKLYPSILTEPSSLQTYLLFTTVTLSPAEFMNNHKEQTRSFCILSVPSPWSSILCLPSHPAFLPRIVCWFPVGCLFCYSISELENTGFQCKTRSSGDSKNSFPVCHLLYRFVGFIFMRIVIIFFFYNHSPNWRSFYNS